MKISLNWLKEFVDISDDPADLGRRLTGVGLAMVLALWSRVRGID